MRIIITFFLCLFVSSVQADSAPIQPTIKNVKLEPFTTLNVALVPDLGTRFVFPFVLDEGDDIVPFTLDVTNPLFIPKRHNGRNFFTIEVDPPEDGGGVPMYLSNLFVSVGGYHLSIVLSTTTDLRKHVSDYVFELSDAAREDLIQQAIKKRTSGLEESYKKKQLELDRKADEIALRKIGLLAMHKPSTRKIKEEAMLELPTGERVELYLDEVLVYDKKFYVFRYEITNDTADVLRVSDAALFIKSDSGVYQKITGANSIIPRIEVGETARGFFASDSVLLKRDVNIKFSAVTSQGNVEAVW